MNQLLRHLDLEDEDRRTGLGGSDSPVVLGVSPFKTRRVLWQEKMGLIGDEEENPAMKRGHFMEDTVAEIYRGITGHALKTVRQKIIHPEYPFIFAHVDRLIEDPKVPQKGPGVLEIKCPGGAVARKIDREGMQQYYIVQLQHYLGVTGCRWGVIVVLHYDEWKIIPVEITPDRELIRIIFDEDVRFWECVQKGEEPPEPEVKIEMEPVQSGELVNMDRINPHVWASLVKKYQEAEMLFDEAKALLDLQEQKIKEEMAKAGATVAEGAGARIYWKEQKGRLTLDRKAFAKGNPAAYEIYESYMKTGKPSRPFRAYFPRPILKE